MRGRQSGRAIGPEIGCHAALIAHSPPHLHLLTRTQFGEAETPQRLHVDEDVLGALVIADVARFVFCRNGEAGGAAAGVQSIKKGAGQPALFL